MPALEAHLTMVYLEPLGTGGSGRLASHPDGYTRRVYADAIDRVVDHIGHQRVHLLGHSYGGFVAQRYALDHPDRISGLILYESAPATGAEYGAEVARRLAEFAARNAGHPELPGVLAAFRAIGRFTDDAELTTAFRALLPAYFADWWGREMESCELRETARFAYLSSRDANHGPEVIDDRTTLPALAVPTLVLVGRHDVICGVCGAEQLHSLLPKSRLEILENSGHFGHLEEPDEFADVVCYFVAATPAG